jgi:ATP/maltotriose-dependent transcriptional regulator MalT
MNGNCATKKYRKLCLELMNQELSNKEIAEKLFVSLSTIKKYTNNIYSKLSISSRKEIGAHYR